MKRSILVGVLTLGFIFVCLLINSPNKKPSPPKRVSTSDFELERFTLVETEGALKKWSLVSNKAFINKNITRLREVRVEIFNGMKSILTLSGQYGVVDRKTKKIKIYSKVVAKGQNGLTLTASTLVWNPKNELIATEGKFTLQKEGLKIEGKALKMNPKMEKVEVKEFSQDKPIKIKATTLIWNRAEEITILKDKVVILHEEKRLIADEVKAFGPFEAPTKFIGKGRIKLSDQKRKLTITSGYVEYDREKEYALFKENPMIIKEGERSFRIHCGFLECFFRENRVDAKENVIIHYLDITTESDFATYDQGKLILYGNPKLKRKNGTFSGERIIVYLEEDRVEIIGKVKGTLLFPQEK